MTTYVYGDQTPKNSKIHDGFKGNQTFFGETIDLGHLIQTLSIKRFIGYNERYKEVIGNNGGERQKKMAASSWIRSIPCIFGLHI
jgi:hypothetical protein